MEYLFHCMQYLFHNMQYISTITNTMLIQMDLEFN